MVKRLMPMGAAVALGGALAVGVGSRVAGRLVAVSVLVAVGDGVSVAGGGVDEGEVAVGVGVTMAMRGGVTVAATGEGGPEGWAVEVMTAADGESAGVGVTTTMQPAQRRARRRSERGTQRL
jgi:hypothetical protein